MATDVNSQRRIQDLTMQLEAAKCQNGTTAGSGWCPQTWDGILCWPSTAPSAVSTLGCPRYIAGFLPHQNATRSCMDDGNWFWNSTLNTTWSNYTQCYDDPFGRILLNVSTGNVTHFKKYIPVVKTISVVGYSVSLSTLIVAFCILATIKKLRCPRNMLHMHLFASFMTRAFIALLKHSIFVEGLGMSSEVLVREGESYWLNDIGESNWECKVFMSVWQYFILANYSWILMEGLYLHNLVFLALFTDSNSSIAGYVVLGWGLPAIFVIPWVVARAVLENTYCWTTNENPLLFLIIRVPTMLSILINFVLFINIVRVLLLKLKSTVSEETQRYKRWARSTLVLVPLFGVHYTVFLGMSYGMGTSYTVEIVWLFCDQLFASFQGFFVAVLYCFLNGEVRAEVSRAWRSTSWPSIRGGRWGPRASTHSSSTCSCNGIKMSHKPKTFKWWNEPCRCCCRRRSVNHSTHSMASTQGVERSLVEMGSTSLDFRTILLKNDAGTRLGGSLASSRGYLEVTAGTGLGNRNPANHMSPLCSKYTDQSLLSFCSNISEISVCGVVPSQEKGDKIPDQHRWSDSECCHLAYELHSLRNHAHP